MSTIRFDGRVAIVTGAGGGLGRQYAREIARRGASVIVNDLGGPIFGSGSSHSAADRVVEEILAAGGKAAANYDTVATRQGAENIVAAAMDHFGRIDVLIGNAGNLRNARFEDSSDENWQALYEVHVSGQRGVAQAAYSHMLRQGYGRILFVTSGTALYGNPAQAAYGAAKCGIVGMMHTLALEAAPHGIMVNAIAPIAASRMTEAMDPAEVEKLGPVIAQHFGDSFMPEFTAPLATYLVSEMCTTSHGIYSSSGGRFARIFVAACDGWLGPKDKPATAEEVMEHFTEISDSSHVTEFRSLTEELMHVMARRQV